MLKDIVRSLSEYMSGANDPDPRTREGRQEIRDCIARELVDYVFEGLGEEGYGGLYRPHLEQGLYRAIQNLVASAMMAQYRYDEDLNGELVAAIVNEPYDSIIAHVGHVDPNDSQSPMATSPDWQSVAREAAKAARD